MQFVADLFMRQIAIFKCSNIWPIVKHIDKILTRTCHKLAEMYFKHMRQLNALLSTCNNSKSQNELSFETTIREFFSRSSVELRN